MKNQKEKEMMSFLKDTSKILSEVAIASNGNITAAQYAENVEFWQWMENNFTHMDLGSSESIAREFLGKEGFQTQIFGKLYEWDWTNHERWQISNLDDRFFLPDDPSFEGIDVFKKSVWGEREAYQLKGYTSGHPDLSNTPHSATVVTNEENIPYANSQGYQTESYADSQEIAARRNELTEQIQRGDATPHYEIVDLAGTMMKAGIFGFAVNAGMESFRAYQEFKSGNIDRAEYVKQILKSGTEGAMSSGATAGIMIPIHAMLTGAGVNALITIPIAFVVHHAIQSPITAAFGRGEYQRILQDAKFYQNGAELAKDFSDLVGKSEETFSDFIRNYQEADREFIRNRDNFNSAIDVLENKLGRHN